MAGFQSLAPNIKLPLTGIAAWIVPGLGHVLIGERNRGLIILVTITVTFWGGVAIGGVRTSVDPHQKTLWFIAQMPGGTHTLAAWWLGLQSRRAVPAEELVPARWNSAEVATVYTGVAGLLSVLAILDALVRADVPPQRRDRRAKSRSPAQAA